MTIDQVVQRIGEVGIVPVIRASRTDDALRAVDAICAGGITIVEITMTVPKALDAIASIARENGSAVLLGAGTVTTAEQAKMCIDAGVQFIVSPGLSPPVMATAQAKAVLAIPGALTPTELMNAQAHGARLAKIFPCTAVGGASYLKSLRGPFPELALIPTGGVNASNAADYISAGAFALGVGSELVNAQALKDGKTILITEAARSLLRAVEAARGSGRA
jgi:2-dehydro-3-deoxyphosphogluconate aldolase / (4S)-4-hydroxy-2-oxoglutarate aldolase